MGKIWKFWKQINNKLIDKESSLLLSLLYFILIGPFACVYKLFSDPFNLKIESQSFWFVKNSENIQTLKKLQNQF